ncbi:MAG: Mth938-like domain-containing protein [Azoarcus sp.]|jgi:uncharacterized protein|nr:Mth938-like domain-containing protein [Azoarcus sp.]
MNLHPDLAPDIHLLTAHGKGFVNINQTRHEGNLIVTPQRIIPDWTTDGFDALAATDFAALATLGAKIVLLGTGGRQRFPAPALLRPLLDAGIALEPMDLPAACRTYNILALEDRDVAAALIFD